VLQKKTHSRFLLFLKIVFDLLVLNKKVKKLSKKSNVKGLKFVLNGKLKGKTRASSAYGQFGCVSISTIVQNTVFAKLHIYTLYGVFGLRAWVYRT
jgi:ribosomal protein S3